MTTDQFQDEVIERLARLEAQNAAMSQLIGAIASHTCEIGIDPGTGIPFDRGTGHPLFDSTGGAFTVPPMTPIKTSRDAYIEQEVARANAQGLHGDDIADLMEMPVGDARTAKALQMAGEGFRLEKRIALRNWDPRASMQSWKDAGYTWVPAVGQPDIPVSPGLTFFGKPSYDPANPPAGSITVDLAFAEGYER